VTDLDLNAYRAAATSHAQALGLFEQVLGHQPVSAPGSGLTYAMWAGPVRPVPSRSGLNVVSARLELRGQVFLPADSEPMDDVDVAVTNAVSKLMGAYCGDFTLGDLVGNIDLLGAHGTPLSSDMGYTTFAGGTTYRVATLTIPLIINAAWNEAV
jgi:hypothetical protein